MLWFAYDIMLLSEIEEQLLAVLEEMEDILGSTYNMKINKNNTTMLVVSKHCSRTEVILQEK